MSNSKAEPRLKDVIWDLDDSGYGTARWIGMSRIRCFTLKKGIEDALLTYLNFIKDKPNEIQRLLREKKEGLLVDLDITMVNCSPSFIMHLVYPLLSKEDVKRYSDVIMEVAQDYLFSTIPTTELSLETDDYTFLIKIGSFTFVSDWSKDCVICLSDDVGHVCCHAEVAMFRPCGHTMCYDPCFLEYKDQQLCPTCRTKIDKVIFNNDVKFQLPIDDLVSRIMTRITK